MCVQTFQENLKTEYKVKIKAIEILLKMIKVTKTQLETRPQSKRKFKK